MKAGCLKPRHSLTIGESGRSGDLSERQKSPQLGLSPIFHERPLLWKAVVQDQNFKFPVVNGSSAPQSCRLRKSVEWPHRAQRRQAWVQFCMLSQLGAILRLLLDASACCFKAGRQRAGVLQCMRESCENKGSHKIISMGKECSSICLQTSVASEARS